MNSKREAMAEMMMDLLEVGWYGDRERANEPIKEMRALVEEVVPLQESFALSRKHTETGRGAGISPHTASLLLYNEAGYTRVRKFVLGFWQAVQKVFEHSGHEQVRVLYIGTGPFATLALPIAARFPAKRLVVHVVDIHQESLDVLDRVVRHFGVGDSFPERTCTDATTVDWGRCLEEVPDIVVTECMDAALLKEPQVAIVRNLASQVEDPFLLVPELVRVSVSTQPFFDLDRKGISMQRGTFEESPNTVSGVFDHPTHLETVVQVFGDQVLAGSDSTITRTIRLPSLRSNVEKATISYRLGGRPTSVKVKRV